MRELARRRVDGVRHEDQGPGNDAVTTPRNERGSGEAAVSEAPSAARTSNPDPGSAPPAAAEQIAAVTRQVAALRDDIAGLNTDLRAARAARAAAGSTLGGTLVGPRPTPTAATTGAAAIVGRLGTERVALALLVVAALALRLIWLDRIPTNVTADEADNLRVVLRIEELGEPGWFGLDWKPAPAFSMRLAALFVRLVDDNVFGLRLPSAIISTLALIPFYALARRAAQPPAALAAVALLATSRWYLHFSRSGWENVQVACYALLGAWAVTVALERRRWWWFAVAGVAAALGLYGYFAGRLILVGLLTYAPLAWWWARGRRRSVAGGFALLTLVALLLFYPQYRTIRKDWDYFNRRADVVYVLNAPRPYLGATSDAEVLWVQVKRTVAAFLLSDGDLFVGGVVGRYGPEGEPLFDPVTGVLFAVGLGLSLRRPRGVALWWCMLVVPLFGTQVLSSGTPDAARAVIIAPFVYLFVALALQRLLDLAARIRAAPPGWTHWALASLVLAIVAVNVWGYFSWIRTPEAARARQPALERANYEQWEIQVRCELRPETCETGGLSR